MYNVPKSSILYVTLNPLVHVVIQLEKPLPDLMLEGVLSSRLEWLV